VPFPPKITAALHDLLASFQPGWSALAHLAGYVEKLRADNNWSAAEIRQFESAARRLLVKLVEDESTRSGPTRGT
jgi:hypothetical protein